MSRQQFICGLSHEVTIAVLPRLNMQELMFELDRRIQNLDKQTRIKDRLVSILRDVMLEEYRQFERKSEETTIPVQNQETLTMQENALTAYAETTLSETSSPDPSQQSSGLNLVIKKEKDVISEMAMHTVELELSDTDNVHLTVLQQDQLCSTQYPGAQLDSFIIGHPYDKNEYHSRLTH
ncbi:uncharacterized protein LOC144865652 [Branchiostoma floridae x Branchiostoma japonicum]